MITPAAGSKPVTMKKLLVIKKPIVRIQIRFGDEERRLMHLVPAPAVKLMKGRVLSRPGMKKCLGLGLSLLITETQDLRVPFQNMKTKPIPKDNNKTKGNLRLKPTDKDY